MPVSTVAHGDTFEYEIKIDISDIPDLKTLAFRVVSVEAGTMRAGAVPVNNCKDEVTFFGANVVEVFSTDSAFAALKADGSVVTWGRSDKGGDSSAVSDDLGR